MTPLALILLCVAALVALFVLPFLVALVFEAFPLIIAIVIALAIYNWLT